MSTLAPSSQGHRLSLDGLRGFAIIFVLIEHSYPEILPYGYLGVDIFFVLSGFVVTLSLLRTSSDGWHNFLSNFFVRRFKRLAPILYLSVLLFSFVAVLFVDPSSSELITSLQTGMFSLFGLSNIYLFFNNQDYFSILSSYNLFLHTWSLGIEEQFYLIFPLIFYFVRDRRTLLFTIFVLAAFSYSFQMYYLNQPESYNSAFYLPLSRFWQLLLGSLAALCLRFFTSLLKRFNTHFINICSFVLTLSLIYGVSTGYVDRLWVTYTLISFNVVLLIILLEFDTSIKSIYQNRAIVFFGLRSYSIYLFHWPLLVISSWIFVRSPFLSFYCLMISVLLSIPSLSYIENPFRYSRLSTIGKNIYVVYLMSASLVAGLLYSFILARGTIFLGESNPSVPSKRSLFLPHRATAPSVNNSNLNRINCFKRFSFTSNISINSIDIKNCHLPSISGNRTIYLYGDSFAAHLSPLLEKLHFENGFGVEIFTRARCPFPPRYDIVDDPCYQFFLHRKSRLLSSVESGDVLLLATSAREPSGRYTEAYMSSLRSLLTSLKSRGVLVIYQDPLPRFPKIFDPVCTYPTQWFQFNRVSHCISPSFVNRDSELIRLAPLNSQLDELSLQFPNFYIQGSFNILCSSSSSSCSSNSKFARLYRDGIHLSTYAAQMFYESFLEIINSNSFDFSSDK